MSTPARGLPPRIYVPILAVFAVAFLGLMAFLLRIGLGNTGTALGPASLPAGNATLAPLAGRGPSLPGAAVGGGPPAPVRNALADLRARLRANPRDVAALLELGSLYAAAGKDMDALGYYRRAAEADPSNAEALYDEGETARSSGRRAEAIAAFRRLLRVAPDDPHADDAQSALRELGASS